MAARRLNLIRLIWPYWKLLTVALAAMIVEGSADLLEPWPLKVIFDNVLGSKRVPAWLSRWMIDGTDRLTVLNIAAGAVVVIAIVGAISSYTEKYLSTTVAKRVGFDLRHLLYHHAQRLSLSFYEHRQTGDMARATTRCSANESDTLSGEQRARIAIARAIIRNSPILLLDEPSAAFDPESEQLIFEGLSRLMEGKTSITIAHRLATVQNADVIFVLSGGVISERGTRDQLLARNGLYARLYHLQFRNADGMHASVAVTA